MHVGCISLGEVQCDGCHRNIPYPERYLVVDEKDGVEVQEDEEGVKVHYCVDCSLKKGYASHKMEKGEEILTFFPK